MKRSHILIDKSTVIELPEVQPIPTPPAMIDVTLEAVFVFQNKICMVFGSDGQQIPELQGHWPDKEQEIRALANDETKFYLDAKWPIRPPPGYPNWDRFVKDQVFGSDMTLDESHMEDDTFVWWKYPDGYSLEQKKPYEGSESSFASLVANQAGLS